jgi:hypothetical protein
MEIDKVKEPSRNIPTTKPHGRVTEQRDGQKLPDKPKPNHKYLRDKHREMVKGIFRYYEVPGGVMEFVFKEFREDQVEKYSLYDGQIYTLPLGVAKHLNKNGWYPVHAFMHDENGNASQKINRKVRRVGFQSLEFVDIDDIATNDMGIITVEDVSGGMLV